MPLIDRDEAYRDFKTLGSNSSHFVWFLAGLQFYKTKNQYVFAYLVLGEVTLFALEPLSPLDEASFQDAWQEVLDFLQPKISAFLSVDDQFLKNLKAVGFEGFRIGSEPWVKLSESLPKGNAGKGVRSARNQAVKAGLRVEEWSADEIKSKPEKGKLILTIYKEWEQVRWLSLKGFTLSTDPFFKMEDRRYFFIISKKQVEGYLIASPIPKLNSYYLEDLVLRRNASRGAGELLTLEAMTALHLQGFSEASLGVVAAANAKKDENMNLPPLVRFLLITVPAQISSFYNFEGMAVYRKRFKPHRWSNVYLAARSQESKGMDSLSWFKVFIAVFRALKPVLQLSFPLILKRVKIRLFNNPIAVLFVLLNSIVFYSINHGGDLPFWALKKYGFSSALPFQEWLKRSVTSDFVYSSAFHFYSCIGVLFLLISWAEKTHTRLFLLWFLICTSVFDDFINYFFMILPFKFAQPGIFNSLILLKDVGASLMVFCLLGLQLCQFKKNREILFVGTSFLVVMSFALFSGKHHTFILNLNHFLFLSLGYVVGKLKYKWDQVENRKHSKGKTPQIIH